jgi:hypothetical protein
MSNSIFAVTFTAPVTVYGLNFTIRATACPRHNDRPAVLWLEDEAPSGNPPAYGMLPIDFWQEVERQLTVGGPVRDAYEAELEKASEPSWHVAAE